MASMLDYIGGNVIEAGIQEVGKWANKDLEKLKIEKEYYSKLLEIEKELQLKQGDINLSESKAKSLFIAGARPFVIWVGGLSLAYEFMIAPFLHSIFKANGYDFPLPMLDATTLMTLVSALLGLGGMRTYEKANNIHNNEAR